jgi:hypothetical protein
MRHRKLSFVPLAALLATLVGSSDANADFTGELKRLGVGGCRTADGGEGRYTLHQGVSLAECQELCFGKAPCAAVEYNEEKRECEVHVAPIVELSEVKSRKATCYVYR